MNIKQFKEIIAQYANMEVSELKVYEKEAGVMSNVNNISRVIKDKNGNTVVRKKLFSISIGTIVAIASREAGRILYEITFILSIHVL